MRKLKCVEYKSHGALTDFINTHGISENDIQQIVVVNNTLILFYWE